MGTIEAIRIVGQFGVCWKEEKDKLIDEQRQRLLARFRQEDQILASVLSGTPVSLRATLRERFAAVGPGEG